MVQPQVMARLAPDAIRPEGRAKKPGRSAGSSLEKPAADVYCSGNVAEPEPVFVLQADVIPLAALDAWIVGDDGGDQVV